MILLNSKGFEMFEIFKMKNVKSILTIFILLSTVGCATLSKSQNDFWVTCVKQTCNNVQCMSDAKMLK
jgi:hypothetical protein